MNDHQAALEIAREDSPEFQRVEAIMDLRRACRDLCRQAVISNLTNLDACVVVAAIASRVLQAAWIAKPNPKHLRNAGSELGKIESHNTEVVRLISLASDAFTDAAVAIEKAA